MIRSTIAIVNDEPTFRHLLSQFLKQRGHDLLTESNEDSAMGTLVCRQPSAVVIEVTAGSRFSALRLVERIRANRATAFMPVIVCSPDDEFHTRHTADLKMFGCSVIGKPFDGDLLIKAIEQKIPVITPTLSHTSFALTAWSSATLSCLPSYAGPVGSCALRFASNHDMTSYERLS